MASVPANKSAPAILAVLVVRDTALPSNRLNLHSDTSTRKRLCQEVLPRHSRKMRSLPAPHARIAGLEVAVTELLHDGGLTDADWVRDAGVDA